jgi:NADPH:quinone reductase-like Zn-dependent oxidoreductase
MSSYRIVRFHRAGGPEVLQLERAERREPGRGEVSVRVLGIGMTQGDVMYRRGTYLEQPELPSGLGTEICGEVERCGEDVHAYRPGDRVSSISSFSINRYPLYGEYAVLPEFSLIRTPAQLTDTEGAAFTLAYVPMYLALLKEARLQAGDWLVLNAAGATTSLAACQIAKLAGARVIGIVRSDEKRERLRGKGFDELLVWSERIAEEVREVTGRGADVVMDPVLGDTCQALSAMAGWRARIIHYGSLSGNPVATHSALQMVPKFLTIKGFTIYGYSGSQVMGLARDAVAMQQAAAFLEYGFDSGALRPLIAATYPLEQIVRAHAALEAGLHVGKLVVLPGSG